MDTRGGRAAKRAILSPRCRARSLEATHRTMAQGENGEAGAVTQPKSCLLGPHPRPKRPASDFVYLFIFFYKSNSACYGLSGNCSQVETEISCLHFHHQKVNRF